MRPLRSIPFLVLLIGCGPGRVGAPPQPAAEPAPAGPITIATLPIPGDPRLVAIARDVMDARVALAPNIAADAGLFEDAVRVPRFAPAAVREATARLQGSMDAIRALPWSELTAAEQVDARWLLACAEEAHHRLAVEQRWTHRPAEWLEPVGYSFVALATYLGDGSGHMTRLAGLLPSMLDEVRAEVTDPTRVDVDTAVGTVDGLLAIVGSIEASPERDAALAALEGYRAHLASLTDLPEYRIIGEESYTWRLERHMLLPWTADQLLEVAQARLDAVDAEAASLANGLGEPPPPTDAERAKAEALTREGLVALYEDMVAEDLATLRGLGVITVPDGFPAMRARETPDALVPFTGDGGSMNPPTLFGPPAEGWWNVEHFREDWDIDRRLRLVVGMRRHRDTGYGPYAVHEGVPGHHLQLAMVRANPDPIRTLLWDNATVEGWGLYAEELFWEAGGFGTSQRARSNVLGSDRSRIRRVFYDVNVERGTWTLQEAADWKSGTEPGEGAVDHDLLRALQWPTQLIGYFAGKQQILELRDELRARQGDAFSERAFHDAILAAGLVPMSLVRAELLGEPIPPP